jgi:hypothetical protein
LDGYVDEFAMKPNTLKVLEMCIEIGLSYGWRKAHKHNENPTPSEIQEAQQNAIMGEIWEWFDMGDTNVGES